MQNFFYTLIIYPLVQVIEVTFKLFYSLFKSTGFAVVGVSVGVSVLCLPLYIVAEKWQETERKKVASMAGSVARIKKAFHGDEGYMVLSTFYRQNNYSPIMALRSSFGLLIQIPFFIAAYSFLSHCQMLQGKSFLFIRDMGSPDALFSLGGFALNILPIAMTAINILAGVIYTKGHALREKVQIYAMALVFLVILYQSPAGLVLYWTMNNLFSLVKNIFYHIKKPLRVLYVLLDLVALSLIAFLIFAHHGNIKKRALMGFATSLFFFIPLIVWAIKNALKAFEKTSGDGLSRNLTFFASSLALGVLTALVIPAAVISSSTVEFVGIDGYSIGDFFAAFALQAAGVFLFWAPCVYLLFGKRIKTFFALSMLGLLFAALINTFVFQGNYATLSRTLSFAGPVGEPPILLSIANLSALLLALLAPYFLGRLFKKSLWALPAIALISLLALGTLDAKKIFREEKLILATQTPLTNELQAQKNTKTSPANTTQDVESSPNLDTQNANALPKNATQDTKTSPANTTQDVESSPSLTAQNTSALLDNTAQNTESLTNNVANDAQSPTAPASQNAPRAPIYTLSKSAQNVFFLMLDRAESAYFPLICDAYPAIKKAFEGFSYYPNTVSFNQGTLLAAPALFAGYDYTPLAMNARPDERLVDKHNEALKVLPTLFSEAGFSTTACDLSWANYSWIPDLSIFDKTPTRTFNTQYMFRDEWIATHPGLVEPNITSKLLFRNMLYFALFKMSPMAARNALYNDGSWWSSQKSQSDIMETLSAYSALCAFKSETVATDTPTPAFFFVVNDTTHSNTQLPLPLGADEEKLKALANFRATSVNIAALSEVAAWLDKLRAEGVFDNTRILIAADHGIGDEKAEAARFHGERKLGYNGDHSNPLFLFKDFNSAGKYITDNRFMTNADAPALLTKDLIKAAKNPYTGHPLKREERNALGIVPQANWRPGGNGINTFKIDKSKLLEVSDNIFDYDNWKVMEEE